MAPQAQKKQWTRVSWRRVGVTLLVIFVALWVINPAAMHVMAWYYAQKEARDPRNVILPQPLSNLEMSDLSSGADVRAFGYSFRVPWKVEKQESTKSFSRLEFANGTSAMIIDDSKDSAGPGMLVGDTPAQTAALEVVYSQEELSSKFEFLRAELNASPADVSFWHSRAQNAAVMTHLLLKSVELQKSKTVYSISLGDMHGFQAGDPAQETNAIRLWLFDAADRETWVWLRSGKGTQWTQPEINAMVASMHITAPQ